jgi:type II secretory pathway component PulF
VRDVLSYPMFVGLVTSFGLPFLLLPKRSVKTSLVFIAALLAAFLLLGGALFSSMASMMLNTTARTRARFARLLAATLEAGLPLGRAVRLSVDASGNRVLADHIKKRSERELSTTPLATLFEGCAEVPPLLLGQMRVADATGDYRGTLSVYAREIEKQQH